MLQDLYLNVWWKRTASIPPASDNLARGRGAESDYPDDVSEDGLIYHYHRTSRPSSRDAAEVEATKNASRLGFPVFIILPGETNQTRCVRLGWIEIGTMRRHSFSCCLANSPTYSPPAEQDEPFSLTDHAPMKMAMVKVRGRQQVFRFQVLAQYGAKCAVCSITHPLKAAHIRGKREKGSDDGEMAFLYAPLTMTPTMLNCLPFSPIRFQLSRRRTLIPPTSGLVEMRSR